MSFAASIIARLGLDTSGFRSDLASTASAVEGAHNKMGQSAQRNAAAHENLLGSNHRVARQIQGFSKDLLSGASATDVFSSGLEGLERALKLPLGALAGLGIGAVVVAQIAKVTSEFKKLNEEVEKLTAIGPSSRFSTLDEIKKQADEADKKIKELEPKVKFLKEFFKNPVDLALPDPKFESETNLDRAKAFRQSAQTAEVGKLSQQNALHDQPEFISKAAQIEERFLDTVQRLGERGVVQLERELSNLAADVARTRRERLQTSLEDIAKRPELNNGLSSEAAFEGRQAREALREIELANQARDTIGGEAGLHEAQIHMNRGDIIRGEISSLKDSEKDLKGTFQGAIESASIFREMLDALRRLSFTNQ